ncbi:MAG: hypothetical protein IJU84_07450 [Clostridia bacterium]|nr:hypothetical protein [Clostridia bacterium]
MEILKITERENNLSNIAYMYGGLMEILSGASKNFSTYTDGGRSVLEIETPLDYAEMIRTEVEDKIADIIAVNYKYSYFSSAIKPYGLTPDENGILLSALISADIDDDKQYIKRKIRSEGEYSVDGLFNFRLSAIKKKWEDVASYIPKTFDAEKLKDFIAFILEEKAGVRVFVENGKVFDRHFRRINRTSLTGREYGDDRLVNEILLSACGEAELLSRVTEGEENYLKEYIGGKIIFGKTYFSAENN